MTENVKVQVDAKGDATLTILDGKALPLKEPQKVTIGGDIKTIGNFVNVRRQAGSGNQQIDTSKAIVIVDRKELAISLLTDPENPYGAELLGKLEVSDELKQFFINKNKTFDKSELVNLIRMNRLFFADADKHKELLLAFQKVSSSVNINANDSADTRGNKARDFVKTVTTNVPTEFILDIPVFKGFPNNRFRVEIALDVTEGSARFWFESVELHELIMKQSREIINQELENVKDFVIINV